MVMIGESHEMPSGADGRSRWTPTCPAVSVHIVDGDDSARRSIGDLLCSVGYDVLPYRSATEFLKAELPDTPACLLLEVQLPGMSGLELQGCLPRLSIDLPVILMTGFGDIATSVRAMKAGAVDFLTKPVREQDLLDAVAAAIRVDEERRQRAVALGELRSRYAKLTTRQRQVMTLAASGLGNKQIAYELSICEATVKLHRKGVMEKLAATSIARLGQIAEILGILRSRVIPAPDT